VHLPDPLPRVVLSLNVGSSSLKAAVRDPDLRMHVELAGLGGAAGHLTMSGTGSFVEHAILPDGWTAALPAGADAVAAGGGRGRGHRSGPLVHPDLQRRYRPDERTGMPGEPPRESGAFRVGQSVDAEAPEGRRHGIRDMAEEIG
jgi:hypothetical protein